jgi:hypothetical protein
MTSPAPLDPQFSLESPLDTGASLEGPLETHAFPATLSARVVTPGAHPRLHGYDVERDLALHYDPTELLFLSFTGELPAPNVAKALRVALTFLAPVSIAHASVHAASLARLCGSAGASIVGVAAIGLSEQARLMLAEHAELLSWLQSNTGGLPERYRATTDAERKSSAYLRAALAPCALQVPALAEEPTREAAILSVLFACGLVKREQLVAAIVTARLPSAVAEALSEKVVDFAHYPINLPHYRYEETP